MSKHGEVLATATEEHRAVERSNAEIAIGTHMHKNTGGRAFSAHTRAPADRNAALKSFTISNNILVGECSAFLANGREPTAAHQRMRVA